MTLVARLREPDKHDPACPFQVHCYCDDAKHDTVSHPLALEAADALERKDARIAELETENERLRTDCKTLAGSEVADHCEGCGAWLMPSDDYVTTPEDGIAGCWAAITDLPSKRERPCYAYRVGKPVARIEAENA